MYNKYWGKFPYCSEHLSTANEKRDDSMCAVCNPCCGRCPTSDVKKGVICSCGTLNFLPGADKCKNCGKELEKPPRRKCEYNNLMCRYPCRLINRTNENGKRVVCRNLRTLKQKTYC